MRISHQYRFVFFANPKTGSSTVRQLLDPYSDVRPARSYAERTAENPFHPHMRPEEARRVFRELGWDFDGYFKFVFVRNPWARLVSFYEHVRRDREETRPFDEWIYSVRPRRVGGVEHRDEPWRSYGDCSIESFIKDSSGGVLVDKVIRLEDIDDALLPFLTALGLPVDENAPIPRKNPGEVRRPYPEYYKADSAEHVRDLYRYDIVNYGYSFGD